MFPATYYWRHENFQRVISILGSKLCCRWICFPRKCYLTHRGAWVVFMFLKDTFFAHGLSTFIFTARFFFCIFSSCISTYVIFHTLIRIFLTHMNFLATFGTHTFYMHIFTPVCDAPPTRVLMLMNYEWNQLFATHKF